MIVDLDANGIEILNPAREWPLGELAQWFSLPI
jgi:hypothetical protein